MDYRIFNVRTVIIFTHGGWAHIRVSTTFLIRKNSHKCSKFEPRVFGSRVRSSTHWAIPLHTTVLASWLLIAYLVVQIIQRWMLCLRRPYVTLHQGQVHRHEHEHVWHAYVLKRHAKCKCRSLNTVQDMAIIVQLKHLSSLRCGCDLEWRAKSSDWLLDRYSDYLHSEARRV